MKVSLSPLIEKIQNLIHPDVYLVLFITLFLFYGFYRFSLKAISNKRHENLKNRFKNVTLHLLISSTAALIHWVFYQKLDFLLFQKIPESFAFISLFFLSIAFIKEAQIGLYVILFYQNISQGIPKLIVNLFSIVLSVLVFSYLASDIFSIDIKALLATSAFFSLVLGLALQDTLGNLFSGLAMQLGQPFKIGDWIEIISENGRFIGQTQEITWRATFITTFADETLMIPNKTLAQSQIIIYSGQSKPNREHLSFRIEIQGDHSFAKKILYNCVIEHGGVYKDPPPRVLLLETTDSWVVLGVFYSVYDFSLRYRIADELLEKILKQLRINGIELANQKILIDQKR